MMRRKPDLTSLGTTPAAPALKVGIPLYAGFDSLDVMGPLQTFTFAGMDIWLLSEDGECVTSFEGVTVLARSSFAACPQLDMLFVPGGSDPVAVLQQGQPGCNPFLDFLSQQAPGCKLVCSVCTGALLLAGAGLLEGHIATTHWAFQPVLRLFNCKVVDDYRRYVQSGNRVTGAGISSGLDEALYIVSLLYGTDQARRGQLGMQYHPSPIFHAGDPADSDIPDDPAMVPDRIVAFGVPDALEEVAAWLKG